MDTTICSELFFFPVPKIEAYTLAAHFMLFLFRVLPILTQFIPLGANVLPMPSRVGLAIALYFIYFPYLWLNTHTLIIFNNDFLILCIKEVFMGLTIGYFLSLPYWIAQSAGVFVDFQRGSSSLTAQDPTLKSQSSPIGTVYNQTTVLVFYYTGGLYFFLYAILYSYQIMPLDLCPSAAFMMDSGGTYWQIMYSIMARVTSLFCQLSAPPVVAVLLGDMFLGVANRLAPQVQISFLGMSLKSLMGLFLMFLSWNLLISQMGKELNNWHHLFLKWMGSMY